MKPIIVAGVALTALSIVGVSAAADTSGFSGKGSGFYAGGSIGYGHADWKPNSTARTTNKLEHKGGLTGGVDFGYMYNVNIGLELAYDLYSDVNIKNSAGLGIGKFKRQHYFSIMPVFNLPLSAQWNIFAKAGMVYLQPEQHRENESDSTDVNYDLWAPTFALGGSYNLTKNISINTQAKVIVENRNVDKDTSNQSTDKGSGQITPVYTAITVGVNYRF